jgi:hypothetical protein
MADIRIIPALGAINVTGSADFKGTGNSSVLFVSGSGNVGVGTTNPTSKLHVAGAIKATSVTGHVLGTSTDTSRALSILNSGLADASTYAITLGYGASNNNQAELGFYLAGTGSANNRLSLGLYNSSDTVNILGSGKVGIGITNPTGKVDINGSSDYNQLWIRSTGGNAAITFDVETGASTYYNWRIDAQGQVANGMTFAASTTAGGTTFGTPVLTLLQTGIVKINDYGSGTNTGTPAYGLAVDSSGNVIETTLATINGSGTANYVPKWSDSDTLTDSVIYQNGTNVGINTTAPSGSLHIKQSTASDQDKGYEASNFPDLSTQTASVLTLDGNYTTGAYRSRFIKVDRGGNLSVYYQETSGTPHAYTSKVRFGANSHHPAVMQVFGPFEATNQIRISNGSGGQRLIMGNRDSSGTDNPSIIEASNGNLYFGGGDTWNPSGSIAGGTMDYTMTLTDSGNVGVGTTAPSYKLQVSETDYARLSLHQTTTGGIWQWGNDGSNLYAYYSNTGVRALDITNSGRVGIGTNNPSAKLDIGGAIQIGVGSTTPNIAYGLFAYTNVGLGIYSAASGAGQGIGFWLSNGSAYEAGRWLSDGNLGIGTTSPKSKLHVAGAGNSAGGNIIIGNVSDGVGKWSYITSTHYSSSAEPEGFALIGGLSSATANAVVIGGNIYESNPSTEIQFWTHTATTHNLGGSQKMGISGNGSIRFHSYGSGTFTGTAAYNLSVDSSGNIIETANPSLTGTGTANYVTKWSGTNTLTNSVMYDDGTNIGVGETSPSYKLHIGGTFRASSLGSFGGSVGIGTTSPTSKLQVEGGDIYLNKDNASANYYLHLNKKSNQDGGIVFYNNNVADFQLVNISSGDLQFYAYGLGGPALNILRATGNVGIGSTAPSARLDVYQSGSTALNIAGSQGQLFSVTDSLSGSLMSVNDISGIPILEVFSDDRVVAGTFGSNALVVNGANVGVGTSSPQEKLHVRQINIADNTATTLLLLDGQFSDSSIEEADMVSIGFRVENSSGGSQTTQAISFAYNNYLSLMKDGGNVGVGSTAPAYKLDVAGTVQIQDSLYLGKADTASGHINAYELMTFNIDTDNDDADTRYFGWFKNGAAGSGTALMRLTETGNLGIGTTSPATKLQVDGQVTILSNATAESPKIPNALIIANSDDATQALRLGYDSGSDIGVIAASDAGTGWKGIAIAPTGGSVGIGSFSPGYKLDVNGTAGFRSTIYAANIGTGEDNSVVVLDSDGTLRTDEIDSRVWGSTLVDGSGAANRVAYWSDADTLTSDADFTFDGTSVGIGTTAPADTLDINGNLYFSKGSDPKIYAGSGVGLNIDGEALYLNRYTTSNTVIALGGGNVGIGTISPGYKLDVSGSVRLGGIEANNLPIRMGHDSTAIYMGGLNTNTLNVAYDYNGTYNMHINYNGYLGADTQYRNLVINDGRRGLIAHFDGASRYVGIGTYSPAATLHVAGDALYEGNMTVDGIITAKEFHTTFVSASIIFQSGSTQFGNSIDDVHTFTGKTELASYGVGATEIYTYQVITSTSTTSNETFDLYLGRFGNGYHKVVLWASGYGTDVGNYFDITRSWGTSSAPRIISSGGFRVGAATYTIHWSQVSNSAYDLYIKWTAGMPSGYTNTINYSIQSNTGGSYVQFEYPSVTVPTLNASNQVAVVTTMDYGNAKVGIGITNPAYANLTVSAGSHQGFAVTRAGNNVPALFLGNDGGSTARIAANNANLQIGRDLSDTFTPYVTVENDSGNVGIGITTPVVKLDIVDNSAKASGVDEAVIRIKSTDQYGASIHMSGSSNWRLISTGASSTPGGGDFGFYNDAGSSYRMVIQGADGNVGIGVTNPGDKLQVVGNGGFALGLSTTGESYSLSSSARGSVYEVAGTVARIVSSPDSVNSAALINFNAYNSSNGATGAFLGALAGDTGNGPASLVFGRRTGTTAWGETMRIASNGNVGIGTSSPSNKLEVAGGVTATSFTGSLQGNITGTAGSETLATVTGRGNTTTQNIEIVHSTGQGFYSGPGSFQSFGSGVSTILLQGTATNGRAGAIWFKGVAGDDVASLYVTDDVQDDYGTTLVAYSGSIRFATETLASEKMTITPAGNVGIGSDSPAYKLDVNGGSNASVARFYNSSATTTVLYYGDTGNTQYTETQYLANGGGVGSIFKAGTGYTNYGGARAFNIYNSDGGISLLPDNATSPILFATGSNVGIGTTTPNKQLTFSQRTDDAIQIRRLTTSEGNPSIGTGISWTWTSATTDNETWAAIRVIMPGNGNSNMTFSTTPSSGASGLTERMRITDAGNVGIGNTNAITKLHVATAGRPFTSTADKSNGDMVGIVLTANTNENTMNGIWFSSGTDHSGTHWSGIAGSRSDYATNWSTHLAFFTHVNATTNITQATEKMRITGEGSVGIGTTSPGAKLQVHSPALGTTAGDQVYQSMFYGSNGNGSYLEIKDVRDINGTDWTSAGKRIQLRIDSTYMGYIQFNGYNNNYGISFGTGGTTSAPGDVSQRMVITSAGQVTINNNAAASTAATNFRVYGYDSDSYFRLGNNTSNSLDIELTRSDAATMFSVDGHSGIAYFAGSVGIGNTSPTAKLQVGAEAHGSATGIEVAAGTSGANLLAIDDTYNHNWFPYTDGNNYYSAGGHTFRDQTHSTVWMFISSSGCIGIGTVTPSFKLDVTGDLRATSNIIANGYTVTDGVIHHASNINVLNKASSGWLTWATRNTSGAEVVVDLDYIGSVSTSGNITAGGTVSTSRVSVDSTIVFDTKTMTMTDSFSDALTVTMNNHTGCYVKITAFGDWGSHSSISYLGEFFLQNGAGSYNEPGRIIRQVDNTYTDHIEAQIVDPGGTSGARDFVIQLKATAAASFTAYLQYEVRGMFNSVS